MNSLKQFAASSNGDHWFLGTDDVTKKDFVLHRGNLSSGGHETISAIDVFLDKRPLWSRARRFTCNASNPR